MNMLLSLTSNRVAILALLTVGMFSLSASAIAFTGDELSKDAKISIETARELALKAHSGKITDEELEKEKGGSGLRYSFDILEAGKHYEVGIDAKNGKVLEVSLEGKTPD